MIYLDNSLLLTLLHPFNETLYADKKFSSTTSKRLREICLEDFSNNNDEM